MVRRRVMFIFIEEVIREPVIYNLGQQFRVVTNILQADMSEDKGWIVLEMEGTEEDIEQGICWVTSRGVRVDPVADDTMEG